MAQHSSPAQFPWRLPLLPCLLALALLCSSLPLSHSALCPGGTCGAKNTAMVPRPGTSFATIGLTTSNLTCAYMALDKGYAWYSWLPSSKRCVGVKSCGFSYTKVGFVSGRVGACPKPELPDGYCSAKTKNCRPCHHPFKCRKAGKHGKKCCCPGDMPNPIISGGFLKGCKK